MSESAWAIDFVDTRDATDTIYSGDTQARWMMDYSEPVRIGDVPPLMISCSCKPDRKLWAIGRHDPRLVDWVVSASQWMPDCQCREFRLTEVIND